MKDLVKEIVNKRLPARETAKAIHAVRRIMATTEGRHGAGAGYGRRLVHTFEFSLTREGMAYWRMIEQLPDRGCDNWPF